MAYNVYMLCISSDTRVCAYILCDKTAEDRIVRFFAENIAQCLNFRFG